ncbi:Leucine-rich repeat-containing protein 31 [Dissostichus eleginoides]|uniref:Leucine-rich repeat-containing protein 31 n=1 Tax=Dissostichus eleginoides TaxID=100907 RepID=A0AAD9BL37_DISEL|nr:Leucine-rich repeat-containing protein 31 [Dissostichus eleginoides]
MESADVQRGGGSLRRSPFDLIMNQIRRKRAASDRKPLGRFLSRDRTGIPEDREDRGEGERLGKKADSRSLNLAHCDLTATDLLELATLLQFLPQLEEMDVSWNGLIGGSLKALTSYLQDAGGVRALRLCSCRLDAEDLAALGEALGCVPLLEILDLSWNSGLGGGALQGLLGKLPPPLKELHLVSCQLNAADATLLGGLLSVLSGLCVLDVSCNPQLSQEVEAFREFSSSLSHAASITTLRLQACGLTEDGLHALGGSLHGLPSLRQLDLSCNRGLSGVQALPSLPALTELDVSSNKEVGGALHPLLAALPLTQMRRLPLNSCSLSQEAFTALGTHILILILQVVGGHLPLLLDALQPAVLTELRLSSCELTTEDLQHLAAVCRRGLLSSLLVLDLSYNASVGDEGWSALFAAGGLGSLQEVDLSLRPLTSAPCTAWLPALLCALPPLPALTRLSLQRWTSSPRDRKQLKHCLRKRSVLLEWDPPNEDETSSFKSTNQESPEE